METAVKTNWKIDASHTEVEVKVKHLVFTTVTGKFKKFEGTFESNGENFDGAQASFKIEAASIDTNNPDRDGHLKSDDFFAAEKYPFINFTEGVLKHVSGNNYKLAGKLTIRETTKSVEFDTEYLGKIIDPWGNAKTAFEIIGKINRKDFGLVWNMVAEAGALLVAEDVKIHINVQLAQ